MSKNQPDRDMQLMAEARLLNVAEHLLFPYLDSEITARVEIIAAKFRGGEEKLLPDVAYMTALIDMREKFKRAQSQGNKKIAEEILNSEIKKEEP